MAHVVLLGTMDTKGVEYRFLRERIQNLGHDTFLVDAGILHDGLAEADVAPAEVANAAGADIATLRAGKDRGRAVAAMAQGATRIVRDLHESRRLHGILGIGGSGGTSLVASAMRALPIGVPKLIVSTVASGDTRPYVGCTDITMMHSVVDMAGINRISARILENAAAAMAGMAQAYAMPPVIREAKPLLAATMFGVTTPGVTAAREWLEERGYEVLVFHAVGTGGQSMEALIEGGFIEGVLDITTTELADQLVGGVFPAGPDRLMAAGRKGIPQVVSLGALDMVNFGPLASVPERFRGRKLHVHNANVTLMRTSPEECTELGCEIATKLNAAQGPVSLFVPQGGISAISIVGGVFHDPVADQALFDSLKANLKEHVEVRWLDMNVNEARFAQAMAEKLEQLVEMSRRAAP